ncbi:MAG: hydrogenase iron-sulfur subunit [Anaerolineales bacterium]
MSGEITNDQSKILVLATLSGGYRGADSVGQLHWEYPANINILPIICASMFPSNFYLQAFEQGIDAILVMFSGPDCPYKGGVERAAVIINDTYPLLKERGIDTRRLRLVAMCTVCTTAFQREVLQMNELMGELGSVSAEIATH